MRHSLFIIATYCPECHYKPARKCPTCKSGKRHSVADDHHLLFDFLVEQGWCVSELGGRDPVLVAAYEPIERLARIFHYSNNAGGSTAAELDWGSHPRAHILPSSPHGCWKARQNSALVILPRDGVEVLVMFQAEFAKEVLKCAS